MNTTSQQSPGWLGSLVLVLASTLASLLIVELALHLFTPYPITQGSNKRMHPRLGYVIDSNLPEIDAAGFRNSATTLSAADIIVIGDSHTYGNNVSAEDSFPAVLSRLRKQPVYNLGIGSYGIYHYLALLDEVAQAGASDVLMALYLGNDLVSHCSVTTLPYWKEFAAQTGIQAPFCSPDEELERERSWIKRNSALISAVDILVVEPLKPDKEAAPAFEFGRDQRIAKKTLRGFAKATSFDTEGVEQSYGNSRLILEQFRDRLNAQNRRFSVLLIPTRGRVLAAWAKANGGKLSPEIAPLIAGEESLARAYGEFLDELKVPHLNALPFVVAALDGSIQRGQPFYPTLRDGHPLESGYAAYAAAAAELLRRAQSLSDESTAETP
ncbi:MAG: SGNH/GDSL hydrolase family protein [Gammaproteobacteria bacterium]